MCVCDTCDTLVYLAGVRVLDTVHTNMYWHPRSSLCIIPVCLSGGAAFHGAVVQAAGPAADSREAAVFYCKFYKFRQGAYPKASLTDVLRRSV